MRGKSHICLGQYLANRYLTHAGPLQIRVFLLGCIEPDRNPATYLKGSLRHQWLRGHNYLNARRFMTRLARRLESRRTLRLYDYYSLGKLIHYTADAFTFSHNAAFPEDLSVHMEYEASLQHWFLTYLTQDPPVTAGTGDSIMDAITRFHRDYSRRHSDIFRDSRYALQASCCVLAILFAK